MSAGFLEALTEVAFARDLPCQDEPDLFFAEDPADLELAKSRCGPCPLRQECLAGALERHEPWGVWGGQLFVGGTVVARKRPRGRPRKDAAPIATGLEAIEAIEAIEATESGVESGTETDAAAAVSAA